MVGAYDDATGKESSEIMRQVTQEISQLEAVSNKIEQNIQQFDTLYH